MMYGPSRSPTRSSAILELSLGGHLNPLHRLRTTEGRGKLAVVPDLNAVIRSVLVGLDQSLRGLAFVIKQNDGDILSVTNKRQDFVGNHVE